jgi:signal peptidase I
MQTLSLPGFTTKSPAPTTESQDPPVQALRETVESIVVAFILAFLFRAFVAEAFVIPTGSMAPTLMGAHKDLTCEHCGAQYQSSASIEFDLNNQDNSVRIWSGYSNHLVVASSCPLCRGLNPFDLYNNPNHDSFSGDRILVSKFDYVLHDPKRWDVIVFKYPKNARMNYIKRLVGLPGEKLLIKGGDVYTRKSESDPWVIARKPPHKIHSMRQIVSDTGFQPGEIVAAGWPSLWQGWDSQSGTSASWHVEQQADNWSATLATSESTQWLRYYHKFLTTGQWNDFNETKKLPPVDPYSSRLITDFTAYNSSYGTQRELVYDHKTGVMLPSMRGKKRPLDVLNPSQVAPEGTMISLSSATPKNDGDHWVGDLVCDFEVQITSKTGKLSLMLVEQGVQFVCDFDVATGDASLKALNGASDGNPIPVFEGSAELKGSSNLRGAGSYRLEMANFDDQLTVWVNGKVVQFDKSTAYDLANYRSEKDRRPYWTAKDPLDASPAGIGGQSIDMKVSRAKVWRDIYYIAINSSSYCDFNLYNTEELIRSIPDPAAREAIRRNPQDQGRSAIHAVYSNPQWWSDTKLLQLRGELNHSLTEDQYFPMGDNSAASLDARGWNGHHFVEHRYMLGKALLVFWPHYWNRPIPGLPNIARMKLIR